MSLNIAVAGTGPALVLLHGWGLSSRVWDGILPQLNRRFTTACIDLPGHGASPWPPAFSDIGSLADRIAESLSSRFESCFVLGWSLGAIAALALASRPSSTIDRLVLAAATPKFLRSQDWAHGLDPQALTAMGERVFTDFHATIRDFLFWQVHGDEHARPALRWLRDKVRDGGEPNPLALRAGLETLAAVDLRASLQTVLAPTLLIHGERDRLCHPNAGRVLAQSMRAAQFHLIPRAAHAPFISHPDEFCTQLEKFLEA